MIKNKKGKKMNKIISIISFLIVIILLLSLAIITYLSNQNLKYKETLKIKIGEEIPTISDYIAKEDLKKITSDEIIWDNINTEDNKIYSAGEYTGYITFKKKKIILKLRVIDDVNPNIEGIEDITIYENEEVDFLKNIKATDNSHDELNVEVKGEYNSSSAGEYQLSYVATDKSGNETHKEFKLIVKKKEVPKPSTNTPKPNNTAVNENVVIGTTTKGYTIKRVNGIYYVNNILIANKTYALPSSYAPGGMLNEFMNAFNSMQSVAASEGISLSIISGYRSYSRQNTLYNNYVARDGKNAADTYSARPGHSEHQTGLAADINSLAQNWINTPEGQWLNNNCYKYGFIIRYPKGKENITGYMYEPWHIRYVGTELATSLYNNGNWLSLEEYLGITSTYNY